MPIPYCTPEDVVLKLDKDPSNIESDRRESYLKRAVTGSQRWDVDTGNPMRTIRVGSPDRKATWETHRARGASRHPPIRVNLAHRNINPIDPNNGDAVEIRTGRDSYEDITAAEGDEWVLDNRRGELRIYRILVRRAYWENPTDRLLRLTYRAGGLGGGQSEGFDATLASALSPGETTITVDDASGFPLPEFTALVGTTSQLEYVRVTDVNGDELTIDRGVNYTSQVAHDAGATINYAPEVVREAAAAKAAELLVINDDADLAVPDNAQLSSRSERANKFKEEYDQAAAKQSNARTI